ncbi:MAG TPA: hypothetical protein VE263_22180 [Candidatus Angelobacter sp.]|nr:hypothetical protein [Candidatus Angelobacter sp.]
MAQPTSKRIPPYLPFKTFLNSLDTLSQGVPPKLDRSFWKGQSGINQGLIMNAYRFFLLVDANDASTEHLATLAHHPEKRAATLKQLIQEQYMVILDKADITKSTMKMLEDAFESTYAVAGDTKQKAITFFLKAAKFADLPLSPYLLGQLRNAPKKPRRSRRTPQDAAETGSTQITQASGLSSHTVQLAGSGRLTITISANPFTMPAEDRTFFFSVVDMLQKYAAQHPEAQQVNDEEEEEEEE